MQLPPSNRSIDRCPNCRMQLSTLVIGITLSMLIGVVIGRASLNLHLTGWEQW